MGRAAALVWPEDDGDFGDAGADLGGLDDKLEGKLHTGAAQIQFVVESAPESPHAAVAVAYSRAEEKIHQPAQTGIAKIFVQRRHGAGLDAAAKAIAHDQVVAPAQFVDEIWDFAEIIAVVGVAHDDVFTAGGGDAGLQRRAVAPLGDADYGGSIVLGNFNRAIGRAVVRDNHFAVQARTANSGERLLHAKCQGVCFIEARYDDRNVQPDANGFRSGRVFHIRELGVSVHPRSGPAVKAKIRAHRVRHRERDNPREMESVHTADEYITTDESRNPSHARANNGRSWTLDSIRGAPAVWIGIPVATGTSISPRVRGLEPNQRDSLVGKAMSAPDEWLFKPFPRNRGNNPSKY